MDAFAFIIHPIDPKRDVARKYPLLGKYLPEPVIHIASRFWPPLQISHISGARSEETGKEIEGWLIAVPYTAQRMLALRPSEVYRKIIAAGRLAESLGAKMLGLGAYTSVVGDGGHTIARELDIAVTTGDSYTAAVSVSATLEAARLMEIDLTGALLAVVGASGAIGGAVAKMLAPHVGRMLLVGRSTRRLEAVAERITADAASEVAWSTDLGALCRADIVVTVTSAGGALVQPDMLKAGAVVCDVSRPRDVSRQTSRSRDDVLVFDGGLVSVPGDVDFGFDYGVPPQMTYGCMAETMTLTFEGVFEDYSMGKDLSVRRIRQMDGMATRHGFKLAALRSFEHKLDDTVVQSIKAKAQSGGRG